MMYLPRLCEHCLNPTCVASVQVGQFISVEEDGIVLIDQDKCRGWRMCILRLPLQKSITTGNRANQKNVSSVTPVLKQACPPSALKLVSVAFATLAYYCMMQTKSTKLPAYQTNKIYTKAQLDIFLDPHDPKVIKQALQDGVPMSVIESAQKSPVYKLAVDWKLALPLHPEYRTLPMVWYVPPLSPIQNAAEAGQVGMDGLIPDVDSLRIPFKIPCQHAHRRR